MADSIRPTRPAPIVAHSPIHRGCCSRRFVLSRESYDDGDDNFGSSSPREFEGDVDAPMTKPEKTGMEWE